MIGAGVLPLSLLQSVRTRFLGCFSVEPRVSLAPGRVNLIGEHTDYNDGFVLPMALDRFVAVAFSPNDRRRLRAYSVDYDSLVERSLEDLVPQQGSGWSDYVAGVFWSMVREGYEVPGVDLAVAGNIPIGAGLASSAAIELAVARAAVAAASQGWEPVRAARMAQRAENDYVGVSCGIMDQMAAAVSVEGTALLMDCRSLVVETVPLPPSAAVVVLDTGTRRALASEAYNERRRSCERAVRALQRLDPLVNALRDADTAMLEQARGQMDPTAFQRAQHVVAENRRTIQFSKAVRKGDLKAAGRLMNESHQSLRDLYEVSSRELDLATDLARQHPACWGARMTGAGFGGCAVALVQVEGAPAFTAEVESAYKERTGLPAAFAVTRPVGGAKLVE